MWLGGTSHSCSSRLHPGHLVCHFGFCTVPVSPRLRLSLFCGWWINQVQEMDKLCHKEQQQGSHRTLSAKYFKGLIKWRDGNWGHHHVLPALGSLSSPWEAFPGRQSWTQPQLPQGQTCCRLLPPGPPWVPWCLSVHLPHLSFLLYHLLPAHAPDTGRQPRHTSWKPVFQSTKIQNKALPTISVIKTCTSSGWLLPPQITDLQSSIWRGKGFSRNQTQQSPLENTTQTLPLNSCYSVHKTASLSKTNISSVLRRSH